MGIPLSIENFENLLSSLIYWRRVLRIARMILIAHTFSRPPRWSLLCAAFCNDGYVTEVDSGDGHEP